MIQSLLRRIGVGPAVAVSAPDDQTYSEAAMDNAIVDSGRTIDHLGEVAALGHRANDIASSSEGQ